MLNLDPSAIAALVNDQDLPVVLLQGESLEILKCFDDNSIDSFASDPPAGIGFMGQLWDTFDRGHLKRMEERELQRELPGGDGHFRASNYAAAYDYSAKGGAGFRAQMRAIFEEVLRVLKPGAHGFVWALPKTSHWTAMALEEAGFEVRDGLVHVFGTGFPKSHNLGKHIDKMLGAKRKVIGVKATPEGIEYPRGYEVRQTTVPFQRSSGLLTAPATEEAARWEGWGTALKPAAEHWILVRKPLSEKTITQNVLKWGTGAINIDASRIGTDTHTVGGGSEDNMFHGGFDPGYTPKTVNGRFPANFILSHHPECDEDCLPGCPVWELEQQRTGASRFFYCIKPSRDERGAGNDHPTVKPVDLMRYLCRMITPPGGVVLDCFLGSGTTGVAAVQEGFRFRGIDREYMEISSKRIEHALKNRDS